MFTMVDVAGITYPMGMNLDPLYLISTIIGVGLSVDYAVHIAHSFIISKGSKKQGPYSIEKISLEFWLEKQLEIPYLILIHVKTSMGNWRNSPHQW